MILEDQEKIIMTVEGSSAIDSFEYDKATQTLKILFVRGDAVYEYSGIMESIIREWMQSDSMGKYFHKNIRRAV